VARIRTIKPEFWSSPGQRGRDPWARLLYIAMWNWADDHGVGTANPRELMGFAFPHDEDMTLGEFRRILGEVRRGFGVEFYEVDGRPYYSIPTWEKHQKIDKRSGRRYPCPEEGTEYDPTTPPDSHTPSDLHKHATRPAPAEHSAEPAENPPNPRRTLGAGTGEQGNRGTGDSDYVGADADAPHPDPNPTAQTLLGEWLDHCTKRPPKNVIGQAAKQIKALIGEGIDPADIRRGLAAWHTKGQHPSTLPSFVNAAMNTRPALQVVNGTRPTTQTTYTEEDYRAGW
jgi:hypothetical protein